VPSYLSPGVYFEELSPDRLGLLPSVERPVPQAVRPIRPVRSRWKDASSTAILIGFADKGPFDEPVYLRSWSQYESTFGSWIEGAFLAFAVHGYFQNGGTACWVIRSGFEHTDPPVRAEASIPGADEHAGALVLTARYGGPVTNEIEVEITDSAIAPDRPTLFSMSVWVDGEVRERFDDLETAGPRQAHDIVNRLSREVVVRSLRAAPARGKFRLDGWRPADADGPSAPPAGAVTAALSRSVEAIRGLTDQADVVCMPDLMAMFIQGMVELEDLKALQLLLIDTCWDAGTLTTILDPPPALSPQQVREWRVDFTAFDAPCAALYYPWIAVRHPSTEQDLFVPPSGHVAGMIARVASTAGLHRAPANEELAGATGVEYPLSRREIDLLHPIGINPIASVIGAGARVMGARTMSSDPAQRQLARKRVVDFVSANVQHRMNWVVHEPSEPLLWEQIAGELDNLLGLLFRAGVLAGAAPENAYVVRCDSGTNPPELRDFGQVIAEVVANLADGSQFSSRVVFFSG